MDDLLDILFVIAIAVIFTAGILVLKYDDSDSPPLS